MMNAKGFDRAVEAVFDAFSPPRRYALSSDEIDVMSEHDQLQIERNRQALDNTRSDRNVWPQITEAELSAILKDRSQGQRPAATRHAKLGKLDGSRTRR